MLSPAALSQIRLPTSPVVLATGRWRAAISTASNHHLPGVHELKSLGIIHPKSKHLRLRTAPSPLPRVGTAKAKALMQQHAQAHNVVPKTAFGPREKRPMTHREWQRKVANRREWEAERDARARHMRLRHDVNVNPQGSKPTSGRPVTSIVDQEKAVLSLSTPRRTATSCEQCQRKYKGEAAVAVESANNGARADECYYDDSNRYAATLFFLN